MLVPSGCEPLRATHRQPWVYVPSLRNLYTDEANLYAVLTCFGVGSGCCVIQTAGSRWVANNGRGRRVRWPYPGHCSGRLFGIFRRSILLCHYLEEKRENHGFARGV